jgi:hypothetical protein
VPGLGSFVEIEAGNVLANKTENELLEQCRFPDFRNSFFSKFIGFQFQ